MHITTATLLALAATFTNAQFAGLPELSNLPECAIKPATQSIGAAGCKFTDFACICSSPAFIKAVGTQIASVCTKDEQKKVIDFANSVCEPVGKTVPASEVPGQVEEEKAADQAPAPVENKMAEASPTEAQADAPAPEETMDAPAAGMEEESAAGGASPPYPTPSSAPMGNSTNSTRYGNETVPFTGDAARSGAGRLGGVVLLVLGLAGPFALLL